jgi:hypothetical protein
MAVTFSNAQRIFIGLGGDAKPTIASHSGLPTPAPGDKYWAYDTNILYVTRDGTNWNLFVTLA